ncbi:MAG TPA: GNAT family N-acetyltransferase [Kofleriaceae bacterium]|nr:GNAT family N-acetyltransferase [Kofleriaceae bacterium]
MARARIRLARPDDLSLLAAIETAAEQLFVDFGIDLPADSVTEAWAFEEACMEQRLLLAVDEVDAPVGFSVLEIVDGDVYIDEVDVHPAHGRQGIGAGLVKASCDWALAHGYRAITLTTWRDVPWNGPFYRRMGFEEVADATLGPQLAAVRKAEATRGLEKQYARCAMRRVLLP